MTTPHIPDPQPATTRAGLAYLHPDRLRLGGTGVFAGDWAFDRTGGTIPVGFIGTLIDRWNGWAVWSTTRDVADEVIADQDRLRGEYRARRAADGLTGADLDAAAAEAVPVLRFDGDTLVLDEPGRPGGVRMTPDQAGEYVICGWMWTWRAVDPAVCDRIAGTIPADGDHQRWIQLPHTDLRAPHDRLRVTAVDAESGHPGSFGFAAALALDGHHVATIDSDGSGETIRLHSPNPGFAVRLIAAYTAGSSRHSRPVTEVEVLDALVNEYRIDRVIQDAAVDGGIVLRQHGPKPCVIHLTGIGQDVPGSTAEAHRLAARFLASRPGRTGTRWHLWTGSHWTTVTPPAS